MEQLGENDSSLATTDKTKTRIITCGDMLRWTNMMIRIYDLCIRYYYYL